jgi:hypothetical protein
MGGPTLLEPNVRCDARITSGARNRSRCRGKTVLKALTAPQSTGEHLEAGAECYRSAPQVIFLARSLSACKAALDESRHLRQHRQHRRRPGRNVLRQLINSHQSINSR